MQLSRGAEIIIAHCYFTCGYVGKQQYRSALHAINCTWNHGIRRSCMARVNAWLHSWIYLYTGVIRFINHTFNPLMEWNTDALYFLSTGLMRRRTIYRKWEQHPCLRALKKFIHLLSLSNLFSFSDSSPSCNLSDRDEARRLKVGKRVMGVGFVKPLPCMGVWGLCPTKVLKYDI